MDHSSLGYWPGIAAELDSKIHDLIVDGRTTPEFETENKRLTIDAHRVRKAGNEALHAPRQNVAKREREYEGVTRMARLVAVHDDEKTGPRIQELIATTGAVGAARKRLDEAQQFATSKEHAWTEMWPVISDSRNISKAWDEATPEQRRTLINYWVAHVMIVVEPIRAKRRANRKATIVTLRTAPNTARFFEARRSGAVVADRVRDRRQNQSIRLHELPCPERIKRFG